MQRKNIYVIVHIYTMRVDLVTRGIREHGLAIVGSALRFVFRLTVITRREYYLCLVSCGPRGVNSFF
jgi:hypothetical protein